MTMYSVLSLYLEGTVIERENKYMKALGNFGGCRFQSLSMMKKYRFYIVLVLFFLCNVSVKSQDTLTHDDLIALSQKLVTKAMKIFYQESEDFDREDSICKRNPDLPILPPYQIELYSLSLAKVMVGYYDFDLENPFPPVISSGGDIGFRGMISKERISTRAQKISFLMGIFMRYGYSRINDQYGSDCYSIRTPNSSSTTTICAEILQEMGCEQVAYIDKLP